MADVSQKRSSQRLNDATMVGLWLQAADSEMRERMQSLVASATESDLDALLAWSGLRMDEVERIDTFLGTLLAHHLADSAVEEAKSVIDSFPAVVFASVVGRAARIAGPQDIWLDWPAGMQLDPRADETKAVVEHLIEKLPEFVTDFGLVDVAVLDGAAAEAGTSEDSARLALLHAGMQQSVMPLLIERLEDEAGLGDITDPSPSDVVQTLATVKNSVEAMVSGFGTDAGGDVPRALRLLAQSAPKTAVALVNATLGYAMATAADPANWESRDDLGPDTTGIPPILLDAAREELRLRPVGTQSRRTAVGVVATTGRPQLYFDEITQRIGIQLPTPAAPANRDWLVTYGGTVVSKQAVGLEDSSSRPVVPVTEPVRSVLVELGEDQHWRVPAIDTDDPVLIFGADGQSITDKVSLHSDAVTVVYPNDARLVDPVTGEDIPLLTEPRPAEWQLWQVAEVDLRDVHAVQIRRGGIAGEVRSASPVRRPQLTLPHARLDGAVTQFGTPVYAGGPVAVFPPTLSGNAETWRAQIAEFSGYGNFAEEMIMVYDLEIPAAGGNVDILTDDDYPWLGEFVVRLTNPRGRSFQKHFAVAEQAELSVTYRNGGDGFRIPTEEGLSPAEVRVVSGEKPLEADPAVLRLGEDETKGTIELSTEEGAWLELLVKPGFLEFEVPLSDETVARRKFTLLTRPGRLDVHGRFKVMAPGELRHAHLAVASGERDICRVPISRNGDEGVADFGSYADRIALLKSVSVNLDWTRVTGRRRLSVPLVSAPQVDPVQSIAWAEDAPGIIEVEHSASVAHVPMTLWVWCARAPWLKPVGLRVIDSECELPEELLPHGPFVVQVTFGVEKDRRPVWPALESVILPEVEGEEASSSLADVVGDLKVDQLAQLWSLFAAMRSGSGTMMAQANDELTPDNLRTVLTAVPRKNLSALNSTSIKLDDQPGMLISSGLVLRDFSMSEPTPGRRRVPWLGALAAMSDVVTDDAVTHSEQLEYLRATGGEALLRAMATGQDATLESACIDQSSVQITALPEAQANAILGQFFDVHRMVPGPLTDDDARFTAIYEVVQHRNEIVDSGIMTGLAAASRKLFQIVSRTSPKLRKAVNVRFHKLDGIDAYEPSLHWTLVPGTSLLIAVAARALARAKAENPDVDDSVLAELLPLWAQLADLVPTLVMSDLLIADALVTFALHGDRTLPIEVAATDDDDPATETSSDTNGDEASAAEASADEALADAILGGSADASD
ncbi:hypothetical protein [Corynebacterium sp. H78]|uniref:hypothetical protein n=1 Tax=Corynebacterium sp. H78 TaxID=3133417 RepID=UPI0030A6C9F6